MQSNITSTRLKEGYTEILHKSGLTILLYPMEGFSSAYALFATKYGSVDSRFKTDSDKDFVEVPSGIAHFLEHKMFEKEDGDAFALYAKTGANANAYTSFDKTAYLFSCTENFRQSIDILLDFVSKPYFSQKTVEKEMGIIAQEIKMYEDNGDWRVFFNLLDAMYESHPVRLDIAGTVESISHIDADLLYRCYNTFYSLTNMVLVVSGNFSAQDVLESADNILKENPEVHIQRDICTEPNTVSKKEIHQTLPVALPLFHIGFKGTPSTPEENLKGQIFDEILLDMIAGESSQLYRQLYDAGLINQTFSTEAMAGRDFALTMFTGESRDPAKVLEEICKEIKKVTASGLDEISFNRAKKAAYGRYVGMYGRVEAVAGLMLASYFAGLRAYELLETVANLTLEQLTARLPSTLDPNRCCISTVSS